MIEWLDIIIRLGAAILIGGVIGLNRDLHHKPTGVRTLALVALGSALAVLAVAHDPQADISRVIQGVITGVGFIGAGVILHRPTDKRVHGLTTAAAIWVGHGSYGPALWSGCVADRCDRSTVHSGGVDPGWHRKGALECRLRKGLRLPES